MTGGDAAMLAQDAPGLAEPSSPPAPRRPAGLRGIPFATLLLEDDQEREEALDALLVELTASDIRVVRLNDPRRPDLTLGRILAQVTGSEREALHEDEARLVVRALTERQGRELRVLLLIEQAETLRPETLGSLQEMAPHFVEDGHPSLQVMFVGRPGFRGLLGGDELAPLRQALGMRGERSGSPLAKLMTPGAAGPAAQRGRWQDRRALLPALLLFTFAVAGAACLWLVWSPWQNPAALPPAAEPRAAVALQSVPPAASALPDSALPEPRRALPVERAAMAPAASPAASGPGTSSQAKIGPPKVRPAPVIPVPVRPATASPATFTPGARIVVHVPEWSGDADPELGRLVAALRPQLGTVQVRRVPATPARPSIRYFFAEDEPAARQVAAADPGLPWVLQDFTWFRPSPLRGRVEVWLPRPG